MNTKRWVGCVLTVGLLVVTSVASAERPSRGYDRSAGRSEQGRAERMPSSSRNGQDRSESDSEYRGSRSSNGLSPEERRQLRRDVHEAGQDIYPERGGRSRSDRSSRRQQDR